MGEAPTQVTRVQGKAGRKLTEWGERALREPDPTWIKAPWALLRSPAVLAALAAAALVLATAGAGAPLFESSVGGATLSREISSASRWSAGLSVVAFGPLTGSSGAGSLGAGDLFARRDAFLRARTRGVFGLGSRVVTILGPEASLTGPGGGSAAVQVLSRTGFLAHVNALSGAGPGVWIAGGVADRVGAGPGDMVRVRAGDHRDTVRIAGVYRDLTAAPLSDYWGPVAGLILGNSSGVAAPPPLLLADQATMRDLGGRLGQVARFTWQFPLATTALSLGQAEDTAARLSAVTAQLSSPDPLTRALFQESSGQTALPDLIGGARRTVGSVKGAVDAVGLAGRVVGLLVVAAAGLYAMERRRGEMALLSLRGVAPPAHGGRAILQALPAMIVGSALGWIAGSWLVSRFGPGGAIDASARETAVAQVVVGALLALAVLAVVAALASRAGPATRGSSIRRALAHTPWELVVLVLAASSYYEVLVRAPSGGTPRSAGPDVFLMLFPILFVVGGAGLAARGLARLLPRIRVGRRGRPAAYLAARRLASAPPMAMLLVAATAAGVGLLVYAAVATSSTDATSLAKARLTTGGDVRAVLAPNASVRTGIPDSTQVARIRGASLLPSNRGVDVLAIDRSTFLRGAYWRSGFGDRPPRALLDALSPWTARTPVLIAGGTLPTGGILSMGAISLPVREVAALTAFPGMTPGRPVVVVNGPDLERYLHRHGTTLGGVNGGTELWVKGRAGPALARLRAAGVPISDVQTAAGVEGAITFRSLSWTLGFLESLGILAAIVAVATTLLYLQAMQRSRDVSYALATRMGLSRRAHRRAVAFELAGMLTVAFVVGLALALGAAMLVLSRLDLVPQIPPAPFLQIPLATIVAVIAALAAVAVAGSVWAQRTADRTKVAEVMRLAT